MQTYNIKNIYIYLHENLFKFFYKFEFEIFNS